MTFATISRPPTGSDAYLETIGERPVVAGGRAGRGPGSAARVAARARRAVRRVLRDLDEVIVPGLTLWNHPRFFACFANTGSEPGILAELLIAALNVNAMAWLTSPAATELELTVLDWLAQLLGLPPGWHGHIEDTASTSTLAALAAARTLRPGGVVYASEQANFSRREGRAAPRARVPRASRSTTSSGCVPTSRSTTRPRSSRPSGTTGTTSVDPVRELARRCSEAGVWLHVDAAYAGSAAVCPELRWCLDGVEHADSIVVNPHKWLFTPMDCSTLWTRRPEAFRAAFALVPDYLAATEAAVDLRDYGPGARPALPRAQALGGAALVRRRGPAGADPRARAPRAALRGVGRGRARLGGRRAAPVLDRLLPARDADNDEIARRATATGELFVATTRLRGADVIRLAIGNAWTTRGRRAQSRGRCCASALRRDLRPLGDADRLGSRGERGDGKAGCGERVGFDFQRALEPLARDALHRADADGARRARACPRTRWTTSARSAPSSSATASSRGPGPSRRWSACAPTA